MALSFSVSVCFSCLLLFHRHFCCHYAGTYVFPLNGFSDNWSVNTARSANLSSLSLFLASATRPYSNTHTHTHTHCPHRSPTACPPPLPALWQPPALLPISIPSATIKHKYAITQLALPHCLHLALYQGAPQEGHQQMAFRFTAPEIILCIKTWICTFWHESFSNYSAVLGIDTDPSHGGKQATDLPVQPPQTSALCCFSSFSLSFPSVTAAPLLLPSSHLLPSRRYIATPPICFQSVPVLY